MSTKQNDERQFTKKPVTIQAIQWTGRNLREVIAFTDGPPDTRSAHAGMAWDAYVDLVARDGLKIYTLEGKMSAAVGDWIIKGVQGEHYPCKPDIFEATYSRAALAAPAQPINTVWPNCVDANLIGSPSTSHPAIGEPPAQQPWQYTPPAQERIQALELEVRQLTEQIAELRHAPTPQADSQPAPVREGEWINDAGRIKWLMWRVQDLEAKLAARAPADSMQEGAAAPQAARDVLAERQRQISAEGWTPEHDDEHNCGEIAGAAGCYARHVNARAWVVGTASDDYASEPTPDYWPWDSVWWKPTNPRRDLVKAGALILAEIERIDRAARKQGANHD